jgi:hypothetical protein
MAEYATVSGIAGWRPQKIALPAAKRRRFAASMGFFFISQPESSDSRSKIAGHILCGEAHFKALADGDNSARFVKATKLDDLLAGG